MFDLVNGQRICSECGATDQECLCCECGECAECFKAINRYYDAMHCATEAAWWRDVGSVLLGLPDDES